MPHTFQNIGFEDPAVGDAVTFDGEESAPLAWSGATTPAGNGSAAGLASWQDAGNIIGLAERFEVEWTGLDTDFGDGAFTFLYDDPPTQLEVAEFDPATASAADFEDFEELWPDNENFVFSLPASEVASFEAAVPNAFSPIPRGGKIFSDGLLYIVNTGAFTDPGITIARMTSNNSVVFLGRISGPSGEGWNDIVEADDSGTKRYFLVGHTATNFFVREFFPATRTLGPQQVVGGTGSSSLSIIFDGTDLWYQRIDSVGLTVFLHRAPLSAPATPALTIDLGVSTVSFMLFDSANSVIYQEEGGDLKRRTVPSGTVTGTISTVGSVTAQALGGGFLWHITSASVLRKISLPGFTIAQAHTVTQIPGVAVGIGYEPTNGKLLLLGTNGSDTMVAVQWDAAAAPLSSGFESVATYGTFGVNSTLPFVASQLHIAVRTITDTKVMYIVDPEVDTSGGRLFIAFPFSVPTVTVSERFPPAGLGEQFEDFEEVWGNSPPEAFAFDISGISVLAMNFDSTPEGVEDFEEEWNGNENFAFNISGITTAAASFDDGVPESFEDFEETSFFLFNVQVLAATGTPGSVYNVIVNNRDHKYVEQGGDTPATIRAGLVSVLNGSPEPVVASAPATQVLIAQDETRAPLPPVVITAGVIEPAANTMSITATRVLFDADWSQSGKMGTI